MTIDGTNINTFGLSLSYISGHLDQPARKKILTEPGFAAKDIKHEGKEITIILIGKFDTKLSLATGVEDLKTLIKTSLVHAFVISGHSVTFSGSVMEGMKIEPIKTSVRITFKVSTT